MDHKALYTLQPHRHSQLGEGRCSCQTGFCSRPGIIAELRKQFIQDHALLRRKGVTVNFRVFAAVLWFALTAMCGIIFDLFFGFPPAFLYCWGWLSGAVLVVIVFAKEEKAP